MYNRKSVKVTTSTDALAISVADMQTHLRTDSDAAIIQDLIESATEMVKEYCRIGLRTETLTYTADRFSDYSADDRLAALGPGIHQGSYVALTGGAGALDLPYAPLQSITSVTTYDRANASSVFSSTKYTADLEGGRIYLDEGETWPVNLRDRAAVEIVYVVGYGSGSIPAPILDAIREIVRIKYDGCGELLSEQVRAMLAPYKRLDTLGW